MRWNPDFKYRAVGLLVLWAIGGLVSAESNPAFWQVSSSSAKVYLLGSMHFGRQDFYPLPPVIEDAFKEAQVLAVEINIADQDPSTLMASLYRHGRISDNGTLSSIVSAQTYAQLSELCKRLGVPVDALGQFQPWFVAMQLVEVALRGGGLQQHLGIDLYFLNRASGKQIDELETLESQLRVFSDLSNSEQESFLKQSLDDLRDSDQYLNAMVDAWKSGDLEALDRELIEPLREDKQNARLFQKIFIERNLEMVQQLKAYLQSDRTVFFVVGAAHMAGRDGILAELRKHGYTPTQLSGKGADVTIEEVALVR